MKKRFFFQTLLLLCALIAGSGGVWAEEKTSTLTFTAKCGGTGTADDGVVWTVTSDGAESTYGEKSGIHYGTDNAEVQYVELSTSGISGTISKVVVAASGAKDVVATLSVTVGGEAFGGSFTITNSSTPYTFTGSASGDIVVRLEKPVKAKKALYVKSVAVTYDDGSAPDTREATTVTLGEYQTTGEVGGSMNLPSATVTTASGTPLDVVPTWESSNTEVASIGNGVINFLAAGTTTIKASYDGDNNTKPSSASFELTVTAAPITGAITSLKALQEAVTSTSTPVTIQFNDVFVTAVKGNNAYLADAQGYGVLVYQKNHGLEAGQVLNGTIEANLVLYNGQTEITGFSKDGLTITTTELTPEEKTISAITAANQSTLVTLKGVTFSNGKLSDGTNEITYYDNFSAGSLEEGATYDLTGIVIIYKTTLEIAPRTADDIVKTSSGEEPVDQRQELTLSFPEASYEATMGEDFIEPVLSGVPEDFDGTMVYSSSNGEVATVGMEGEITLKGPGTTVITAEATFSNLYKGSASYTLTVKEASVELEELANPYTYTFEQKVFDAKSQTKTLKAATWELNVTCDDVDGYFGSDKTKGQQFGSGNKPATAITLSTADIPGTITKIVVNTSGANSIDATVSVKVGDTAFTFGEEAAENVTLTNTATDYEFTGSASGTITLSWANNSAKAIYVKSIYVEYSNEEPQPVWAWADIFADFTDQSFFTEADANGATAGLKMNANGGFTRVAADDMTANAVISGKWHSNDHGISNFSATVKVEGSVKISLGTCAWGGNVTVKDETGAEVVPTFTTNTGACYHQDKQNNIVVAYYAGEAATLTIAGGSYVPYFAVESISAEEIPHTANVTFDVANAGAEGVAPAAIEAEIGSKITIPANRTLYKEGFTLTAWTDGAGAQYKPGDEVTVSGDLTLLPVFTENENVTITEPVTAIWDFQQKNGAPVLNYQNQTGIYVAQAEIGGKDFDVKMSFDTSNGGKIANGNWSDWCQMNTGTKLTIPAVKGMTVSLESYTATTTTTIAGSTDYTTEGNVVTYTYEGSGETIDIVIGDGSYFRYVKVVCPVPTEEAGFADIKADFTDQSFFTEADANGATAGLKMNADGTFTRVAADDVTANAIISGKWHSNDHGISNFSATVAVEGTVKISFGTCAWGGDVTVKNAEGETVATMNTNTGACYHQDKENNIVSCYYKQDVATTLTISGGSYVPYFAVEKVDPKDVPSDVKLIFDVANSGAEGVGPADEIVGIGKQYTLPKNFTLYKEGYTLTGWAAEGAVYAPGETITAPDAESLTFTPVFSENEVSLADRDEAVTVKWNFRRDAGAPTVGWENQDGLVWVAQATVAGKTIDVALPFSTAPGKFANGNWTDWAQVNNGTTFHVPSCKGATISMEAYGDITTTTIDGQSDYTQGKTISYTVAGAAESVDVVIGDGSYYRYIQVVLPKAEQQQGGGESFDHVAGTINWPIGDELQPVISEDIAGAISSASVSVGNELTINTAKYFDTEMMHYTPVNSNAGNVEGVMIEYRVKPTAGVTFQPTQIDYAAVKVGTDNATYSWSYTVDGEESTITQIDPKPDLLRNNGANSVENGGTAKLMHTETFEGVGECNEFTFRFYISACANNKNICIGNVTISGIVNGEAVSVNMYDLTAVASPEEGGSINIYPVSEQYEEGSEVTLTATENFGYDFVNWTNAAGDEVSTEAKFKYTVNSNETLTANFVAVNTYELALTIDGTNDYMVTINPAPTMVDGKMMYEEGQAVQLTANQYEGLVTFTNWSDGDTGSSKLVSMTADVELTAMYAQADIIAGWDFYKRGNDGRKADFAAQDNDGDALTLVETATGNTSGWLDKSHEADGGYEGLMGAAVNWKQGTTEGDVGNWHWQTKVNAEAFTDINVQFQMVFNYNAYPTYNVEYSLDGEQWTNAGSITMARREIAQFKGQLPAEANNQTELYIRMIADKTSELNTDVPSKNDGNSLGMFFITGTPKLVDDGVAPVLVSTVPADGATGASATGKIVLTFDERVKLADDAVAYINNTAINSEMQNPTSGIVNGKTITFAYKGLEYSTEYSFILPANSVADLTDNFITEPIRLTFTIMTRPSIDKKLYDYVVENVDDLMAAISAAEARADKNVRYRIFIKDGEYTIPVKENSLVAKAEGYEVPECITFIRSGNISLIGESRDGVIITNGIDKTDLFNGTYGKTSKYDGIGNSDVFQISGSDYYFQDLTIESGMDDATGRDLAVQDKATRTIYKNTGLRGFQDTWTSNNDNGLYYFEGGYVRGRTDYMCGKGDAFFNGVELRQVAGGYAAVPSKSIKYGFVYKDCTINGEPATVNYATGETRTAAQADGNYTLGRPWGSGTPIALYIDTKMNVVPSAIGWNEMSGGWPKRFAEYNSMTSTGSQIDLSGRKKTFGDGHENNPILTAEEALEAGDLHNMFGEWDPTLATEQAPIPTNVKVNKDTKVLSWDNSNYALLFAIVKDGKVIDFTIENSYTVDDATASYSVRAANEMGGLSEASATAAITTAISEVTNGEQAVPKTVYNINGIRVQKAQKGLYIINGKKVVVK
ncbi:MAG: Ig-like domain-containing protein [Prevotella sp.]|nr:Ig-like domain-containing protein [Prevotella sp.]